MQNSTLVWIIIAALVVLGGGWYLFGMNQPAADTPTQEETTNEGANGATGLDADVDVNIGAGSSEESAAPSTARVTYTANGFSPSVVTVKKGGSVTWTNQGGGDMWVASAQHPTHTTYSGTTLQEHCDDSTNTAFDQCANGTTYTFTFDKAGTWRYHNHSNASHFGTVIVEE